MYSILRAIRLNEDAWYTVTYSTCLSLQLQVLFDDIGPSLILLSSPELQLRLLLHFLAFLGLPVDSVLCAAPCQLGLLLENLSLLTQGKISQNNTDILLKKNQLESI